MVKKIKASNAEAVEENISNGIECSISHDLLKDLVGESCSIDKAIGVINEQWCLLSQVTSIVITD